MKKIWGERETGKHVVFLWWAIASHFMGCHGFFWGLLLIYDQETNQRRRRINGDNTFITTHSVRFTGQGLNSYLNLRLQVFKIFEIISIWFFMIIFDQQLTPVIVPQFNYVTWYSWTRDELQGSIVVFNCIARHAARATAAARGPLVSCGDVLITIGGSSQKT